MGTGRRFVNPHYPDRGSSNLTSPQLLWRALSCTALAPSFQSGLCCAMSDEDDCQRLLPLAEEWAKAQEEFILERGASLGPIYSIDAERVGIKEASRVRVLIVDR